MTTQDARPRSFARTQAVTTTKHLMWLYRRRLGWRASLSLPSASKSVGTLNIDRASADGLRCSCLSWQPARCDGLLRATPGESQSSGLDLGLGHRGSWQQPSSTDWQELRMAFRLTLPEAFISRR